MKVYELGKELGVKSSVITDILNDGSDKKIAPVSNLTDEQINNVILKIDEEKTKKEQEEKEKKSIRKDSDYRPDEMIPCHSVFPGVLHFYGKHNMERQMERTHLGHGLWKTETFLRLRK